jgi:hypothetical protein
MKLYERYILKAIGAPQIDIALFVRKVQSSPDVGKHLHLEPADKDF